MRSLPCWKLTERIFAAFFFLQGSSIFCSGIPLIFFGQDSISRWDKRIREQMMRWSSERVENVLCHWRCVRVSIFACIANKDAVSQTVFLFRKYDKHFVGGLSVQSWHSSFFLISRDIFVHVSALLVTE